MDPRFAHIRDWIFDLDNCLYPASTGLFALIDERMGAYIQRLLDCDPIEARRVQKAHFHEHGTTLAGLMKEHGVDPHDFLNDVHDIALDRVQCDERLGRLLARLPGRRFVFTNGDAFYARRLLARIGVEDHFDDLHDIHASNYRPKPDPYGYRLLC
jgi:putative hydrolase of the HAD superfamily